MSAIKRIKRFSKLCIVSTFLHLYRLMIEYHSKKEFSMKLLLVCAILFLLNFSGVAASTIDSTKVYLNRLSTASSKEQEKIYFRLYFFSELKNPTLAQVYLEKGYDLAKKNNSYYGKAWYFKINAYTSLTRGEFQKGIYQSKAAAYYFLKIKDTTNYLTSNYQAAYGLIVSSKNKDAKKILIRSLAFIEKDSYYKQQGMIYSLLSHVENDRNILQALKYLNSSYFACVKSKDNSGMYSVFTDFSAFYMNIEDYANALKNSYKALYWVKKIKPVVDFDLATVYLNIVSCYIQLHQFENALLFIKKAEIVSNRIQSKSSLIECQFYKAQCYYELNQFEKATQILKKIHVQELSNVDQFAFINLKCKIHLLQKEFSDIPSYIQQANHLLVITEDISEHFKMNYFSFCYKYYYEMKDYPKSIEAFTQFHSLKVKQLENQKDFRLIRLQIKAMKRENKFAQSQLNFQKTKVRLLQQTHKKERFYFVFGIILMFIVISIIVWSIIMYRKRNIQLAKLNLQLSNLVDEKDILLKEVNHRVKNNFQLMNSILSIQSRKNHLSNTAFIKQFSERIYAMSFIHDHLFQASKLDEIDALPFLTELLEKIRLSSKSTDLTIEQTISNSTIRMSLHELIPLGLIVNELVVNSYKHAFIGLNEGKIQLNIHQNNQWIEINYSDTGIGLPIDFERHSGFVIIEALLKKLNGTMEFTSDKGTHFNLSIPLHNQ